LIDREPTAVAMLASAVVRVAVAPMLAEPHVSSGQVSQHLAGHGLDIVEDRNDWLLVRGADAYEGWMHAGYLDRNVDIAAKTGQATSLGCFTRRRDGSTRALPLRALLSPDDVVEAGNVIDASALARRFPTDAAAIARSAVDLFVGTSYQWGGVTPWGADCSGLVQSVFALHGVQLPRDAWLQARMGRSAGRDPFSLRVGDLLFFSDRADGHVTHVAISLGDRRLVHLALGRGGHAVESLDAATDGYVATLLERFLFARRVL
jgi:cell wall-associated NlpC family hydrolase